MKVCVRLFATFRNNRFTEKVFRFDSGTRVAQVLRQLDLPEEQVGAVLLNARHVDPATVLHDGDVLSIFPLVGGG